MLPLPPTVWLYEVRCTCKSKLGQGGRMELHPLTSGRRPTCLTSEQWHQLHQLCPLLVACSRRPGGALRQFHHSQQDTVAHHAGTFACAMVKHAMWHPDMSSTEAMCHVSSCCEWPQKKLGGGATVLRCGRPGCSIPEVSR